MLNYSLTQVVVGPTHVPHDGSTFTTDLAFVNSCNTIPPLSNSDHYGIVMELNRKPEKAAKAKGQLTWRYSCADWNTARKLVDTFNWDSDYIELSWKTMTPAIQVYYLSNNTQQQDFYTQDEIFHKAIVRSLKKRNQLFKRASQNRVAMLHCVK